MTPEERRKWAERIADNIANNDHSFEKHVLKNGEILSADGRPITREQYKELIFKSLMDPKAMGRVSGESLSIYSHETRMVIIVTPRLSNDACTAYPITDKPSSEKKRTEWNSLTPEERANRARANNSIHGGYILNQGEGLPRKPADIFLAKLREYKPIGNSPDGPFDAWISTRANQNLMSEYLDGNRGNRHQQPHNQPHGGGGRFGRAATAAGVVLTGLSAASSASAAPNLGAAALAAGQEILMAVIPFSSAGEALYEGRRAEALVSFIGDCTWIGLGVSEALRPILRAVGTDVSPGMLEGALSSIQVRQESPEKREMMAMIKDIPALSPGQATVRGVPHGAVYDVAVRKFEMEQEFNKIKKLTNGRDLADLSQEEQEQYSRSLWRIQNAAREIRRVWEKEVDCKLGPAYNYGSANPVQMLRDQIKENLNRKPTKQLIDISNVDDVNERCLNEIFCDASKKPEEENDGMTAEPPPEQPENDCPDDENEDNMTLSALFEQFSDPSERAEPAPLLTTQYPGTGRKPVRSHYIFPKK